MQRADLVSLFAELRTSEPVIVGPGTTSGALYQADHRAPTIYNMDMGYATAICLGLALAVPGERVVALEGDGSTLAGLGVLSTIGRYCPAEPGRRRLPQRGLRELRRRPGADGGRRDHRPGGGRPRLRDRSPARRGRGDPRGGAQGAERRADGAGAMDRRRRDRDPDRWPAGRPLPRHDLVETAVAFKREMMARGYRSGAGLVRKNHRSGAATRTSRRSPLRDRPRTARRRCR